MRRRNYQLLVLFLLAAFLFTNCSKKDDKLIIAISKAKPIGSYGKYTEWIHHADSDAEIINMYEMGLDSALQILDNCDGLLITGGEDVFPGRYGKIADTARCGGFDLYRDSLEIQLIKKAIDLKMPLFGICRGEQIINVTLGGSLIIDIPSDWDTIVKHRLPNWKVSYHNVDIIESSLIAKISASNEGIVNSSHHQAIDKLAATLKATAYADDRIIEAVEWKKAKDKGFLLAFQWHPERLDSANAELSLPFAREFIMQARDYQISK